MPPRLQFTRLEVRMRAIGEIAFPAGKAGNVLRGALGSVLRSQGLRPYARIFEPGTKPRPFVFRASHLNGCRFGPPASFSFGLNIFDCSEEVLQHFVRAFDDMAREGLGPGRGLACVTAVEHIRGSLPLCHDGETVSSVEVQFLTPTELKSANEVMDRPDFVVLIRRIAQRLNALSSAYGECPLELKERALGERAGQVHIGECNVTHVPLTRLSSRTGQTHPLGGFVGRAVYEGELSEFLPLLYAAEVTGVGRHTTWGNGELRIRVLG